MFKGYSKWRLPAWLRGFRDGIEVAMIPLICFQLIRTIIWPTSLDVILLAFFGFLQICFLRSWI